MTIQCACCKSTNIRGPMQCADCVNLDEKQIADLRQEVAEAMRFGSYEVNAELMKRLTELGAAASNFIKKYDAVKPAIDNAFSIAHVHGHVYSGPNYGEELEALRKLADQ